MFSYEKTHRTTSWEFSYCSCSRGSIQDWAEGIDPTTDWPPPSPWLAVSPITAFRKSWKRGSFAVGVQNSILRLFITTMSHHFPPSPRNSIWRRWELIWEMLCLFPVCVSEFSVGGEGVTQLSEIKQSSSALGFIKTQLSPHPIFPTGREETDFIKSKI